jgi:hypothetical protein
MAEKETIDFKQMSDEAKKIADELEVPQEILTDEEAARIPEKTGVAPNPEPDEEFRDLEWIEGQESSEVAAEPEPVEVLAPESTSQETEESEPVRENEALFSDIKRIKSATENLLEKVEQSDASPEEMLQAIRAQLADERLGVVFNVEDVFGKLEEWTRKNVREVSKWPREMIQNEMSLLLFEADDSRKRIESLKEAEDKLLLKLAQKNMNLPEGTRSYSEGELASIVLNQDTKREEILAYAQMIPREMMDRLSSLLSSGDYDEKEAEKLLTEIENFIKRDIAENYLKPGQQELKFDEITPETNLAELIKMIGEEKDIERVLLLISKGKLELLPSGELKPKDDSVSEKLYKELTEELVNRAKTERAKEIEKELRERAGNDPLVKEFEEVLKEKKERLRDLRRRFEFEENKNLKARIRSRIYHSENYSSYLNHQKEMSDLGLEIQQMDDMLADYLEEKDKMIPALAQSLAETAKGVRFFDSLDFNIEEISRAIAGAQKGVVLETYKSPLAKKMIEAYDLRKKMKSKDGLKKAPKVEEIKERDALAEVSHDRKVYIEERIKSNLADEFNRILDERKVADEILRQQLIDSVLTGRMFEQYLSFHVEQEGLAMIIQEKVEESAFQARFVVKNLGRMHDLEVDKEETRSQLMEEFEDKVSEGKEKIREEVRKVTAKSNFRQFIGSDIGIDSDPEIKEILESGENRRAALIRSAVALSQHFSTGGERRALRHYERIEEKTADILDDVPDARGVMEKHYQARAKRAETERKIENKKKQMPNWLMAIFGLG